MSVLLALLSSLLWGTGDFLGGTAARRRPALVVVGLSQAAALLALVPLSLALGARPESLLDGVLAGVLGLVGLSCFYAALAGGTMGVVAPIAALGGAVPVLVGLARGEDPTVLQLSGIGVALAGVVLASGPELRAGAVRPLALALVAAVGFGLVLVLLADGAEGSEGAVLVTLLLMRVTSVGLLAAAAVVARPAIGGGGLLPLVLVGLFDAGANLSFALASRSGLLSVVAVLGSVYPVVTVLLARQLQHERLRPVQVVGVVAALGGVGLIAVG